MLPSNRLHRAVGTLLITFHLKPAGGTEVKETGRPPLWTPVVLPVLIGVCFTSAMSTHPGPVSDCGDPSRSATEAPRNGPFVLEGSRSTCRDISRRGTPGSGPAPGQFMLAIVIDERTELDKTADGVVLV